MKTSPFFKNLACGRFMLLFCRGQQRNVQNVTHVHGDCFYSIDLSVTWIAQWSGHSIPEVINVCLCCWFLLRVIIPVLRFTKDNGY